MFRFLPVAERAPKGARLLRHAVVFAVSLAVIVAVVFDGPLAVAQDLSLEALRALQQRQGDDAFNNPPTVKPDIQIYPAIVLPSGPAPKSHLEDLYRIRTGDNELRQFGYDYLGMPRDLAIAQTGAIPDNYVLGQSDELVVTLRGTENATYRVKVDRDGLVTLPKLNPVSAAGRRFGDFRSQLETEVARAYVSTHVFVTIGSIHQLSILVSGEVRAPGVRIVSGLATALDAITLSGGIKKSGSLRNVQVIHNGVARSIDLYAVIANGSSSVMRTLRDGDRIYVPPIGPTVAITGSVSRRGIYELPPGAVGISTGGLLTLAGGVEIAGSYKLSKIDLRRTGELVLIPVDRGAIVRSGEAVVVSAQGAQALGAVRILGAVPEEGLRPISASPTISDLFQSASDLKPDAYTPFALIKRRDPATNAVVLVPVSLTAAIRHAATTPLQSLDVVYVLTRAQEHALAALATKGFNTAYSPSAMGSQMEEPGWPDNGPGARDNAGPEALAGAGGAGAMNRNDAGSSAAPSGLAGGQPGAGSNLGPGSANNQQGLYGAGSAPENDALARSQQALRQSGLSPTSPRPPNPNSPTSPLQARPLTDTEAVAEIAEALGVTSDAIQRAAGDSLVWVLDEVREPGPYLAARATALSDMIQVAGGVQGIADLSAIEVTSTIVDQQSGITQTNRLTYSQRDPQWATVAIRAQDVIRLRPAYTTRENGSVTVAGQVRYPGVFDILRDERLSSILQRAGGLTEVAYPYGAIFTRKDVALAERAANERTARELESAIPAMATTSTQGQPNSDALSYLSALSRQLRNTPAIGRMAITADPTILAVRPELDMFIQAGDALYIPKRPSTVTIAGEVLNPSSVQFRAGRSYTDYIGDAGGYSQNAEEGRTFIVYPDGSSSPVNARWLSFGNGGGSIPPGSTIVVPRDLQPYTWGQFIKDFTQIVSQLAITAATLSVLRTN